MRDPLTARSECEHQLVPRDPARGLKHKRERSPRRTILASRPCGSEAFVRALEAQPDHRPSPGKRAPKPKPAREALDE